MKQSRSLCGREMFQRIRDAKVFKTSCTGHAVPLAAESAKLKNGMHAFSSKSPEPLQIARGRLIPRGRPWMFNSYEAKLIALFTSLNLCQILHRLSLRQKDLEIFRINISRKYF